MALKLSFRGIPFLWDERGGETTPRFAEHDFPMKRGRWHEDMGQGPQVFTVNGFLIAPSALLVRAELVALQKACRNQRPGTLFHPIHGAVNCVCTGFKWKEARDRLNRIDLDLTFVEDSGSSAPIANRWLGAALSDAVNAAEEFIGGAIDQVWNLVELPASALNAAASALAELGATLLLSTSLLGDAVQTVAAGPLSLLRGGISSLLSGLSVPLIQVFRAFTTDANGTPLGLSADQATTTWRTLLPLATFTLPSASGPTTSRAITAQAIDGLAVTVRRLALLQLANLTRQMSFASSDEAIAARNQLYDLMDTEIVAAADRAATDSNPAAADVSQALAKARAEMSTDLTTRAASLKPVGHITLAQSMPAIAVAYALYGDDDASAGARDNTLSLILDFDQRNHLQDPGLVPGGVALEYLAPGSDGGSA